MVAARWQYSRCMSLTCASKPSSPQASRISAMATCTPQQTQVLHNMKGTERHVQSC